MLPSSQEALPNDRTAPEAPRRPLALPLRPHVWLDDTARERCCDPAWRKILIAAQEWETPELTGIEYGGPSAVAGLDYGWQRTRDAAA